MVANEAVPSFPPDGVCVVPSLLLVVLFRVEQQKSALLIEMNDTRNAVEELNLEKVRLVMGVVCSDGLNLECFMRESPLIGYVAPRFL